MSIKGTMRTPHEVELMREADAIIQQKILKERRANPEKPEYRVLGIYVISRQTKGDGVGNFQAHEIEVTPEINEALKTVDLKPVVGANGVWLDTALAEIEFNMKRKAFK